MCSVWILEQAANLSLCNIHRLDFITEAESVYSAVGLNPYITQIRFVFKRLNRIYRVKR